MKSSIENCGQEECPIFPVFSYISFFFAAQVGFVLTVLVFDCHLFFPNLFSFSAVRPQLKRTINSLFFFEPKPLPFPYFRFFFFSFLDGGSFPFLVFFLCSFSLVFGTGIIPRFFLGDNFFSDCGFCLLLRGRFDWHCVVHGSLFFPDPVVFSHGASSRLLFPVSLRGPSPPFNYSILRGCASWLLFWRAFSPDRFLFLFFLTRLSYFFSFGLTRV